MALYRKVTTEHVLNVAKIALNNLSQAIKLETDPQILDDLIIAQTYFRRGAQKLEHVSSVQRTRDGD
jgi:hypothetical protein